MNPTPEQVRQRLERLAPTARSLVVAVSGGVDSVVLLHLLHAVADAPFSLHVAHFDHALRPDSAADARFVRRFAGTLGLAATTERAEVARIAAERGWNQEDAARRLRYAFLHRVARRVGADAIVTAHTRDDQAETVLLQLLRGAAYLRGMPSRRGLVLRPLLEVGKRDLLAVAERAGLEHRTDATNHDPARTRAWLRSEILPRLEERATGQAERLARLAGLQTDLADFVAAEAARRFGAGPLALGALQRAPPALRREAVAAMLRGAGLEVDAARIAAALDMADAQFAADASGPARIALAPDAVLRAGYGRLEIVAPAGAPAAVRIVLRPSDLPAGIPAALFERHPRLELRPPRPGDRIALPGGTRLLSDLLIDAKVPREERPALRVLATGKNVHWVEGLAMSTELRELGAPHPDPDLVFMLEALALADEAAADGELPVGAVVVRGGEVVGRGRNRSEGDHDPSAHAELLALRNAASHQGDWRLGGATLYVTLEPCPMCFGAALQAHVDRIVYGADNLREGALGSVADLGAAPWKRRIEVRAGVLAAAGAGRLREFFARRRPQRDAEAP